jgi:hypothetical protein
MIDRVAIKAPSFQQIHSQPRIKFANKTLKTHAYSIQVLSKDATHELVSLEDLGRPTPVHAIFDKKETSRSGRESDDIGTKQTNL